MRIKITSVGKTKQKFVLEGEEEFIKRIKIWTTIELKELGGDKFASLPDEKRQNEEAKLFLNSLHDDDFVIVLDEKGKVKSSSQIATLFREKMNEGIGTIVFAIGGATGWHPSVLKRGNIVLSLSALTFTYQMSRLILIEQIYRALAIVKGVPYHK